MCVNPRRKLQKDFLKRIPAHREMNYWEQLKSRKTKSFQRRLERYRIIYTWKIFDGIAPSCGIETKPEGERLGRKCQVPPIKKQSKKLIQTLREPTFQVNGPQLFNSLPASVRNMTNCGVDEFKIKLDNFLEKTT